MFFCKTMMFLVFVLSACAFGQNTKGEPGSTNNDEGGNGSIDQVCQECIKIIDTGLNFTKDKIIQDNFITLLHDQFCGRPNDALSKVCTKQVQGVVPYFMSYLQNIIPKQTFCQQLNLCPPTTDIAPAPDFLLTAIEGMIDVESAKCQQCQLAEGQMLMLLKNQQVKNFVKENLGKICDELRLDSVECQDLLDLHIDQVFNIAEDQLEESKCVELCNKQ